MIYFLLFPGVCSALHQYYFVDKSLSWSEAQSHCRQYGGDLATVHGPEYQERLVEVARKYKSDVWIGLYDDVKSWTWPLSENANYSGGEVEPWNWPWKRNEPNNGRDMEGCVRIYLEAWDIVDCNLGHYLFCFDNNTNDNRLSDSSLIYVHLRKSWWDAQSYCREHHTDLPSIRNMEENKLVYQIDTGLTWKWIRLHRNLWIQVKQSFRIKLSSADIDPNDPEWSEEILKQLHGNLKEKMVNGDLNLTWTKAPDREIFHNTRKDEKQQHPEFADERCPLKVD
ncbi:unnamed protein product [Arctogadus glacialis]